MHPIRVGCSATLLSLLAATLGCGMGPSRTLVSISVSPTVATAKDLNLPVQFVATGTFSAPPTTVTPLPALWKGSWTAVPALRVGSVCAGINPTTGLALCGGVPPVVTITASAPSDPTLPLGTQNVPMVSGTATMNCQ